MPLRTIVVTSLALCVLSFATSMAAAPTRAERRCILALHAGAAHVVAARARTLERCMASAARGTAPGGGAQQCVDDDGFELVGRATAHTQALATRRCSESPTLGPRSADAVNAAFATALPIARVFGPDLDAAVVRRADDRAGAACQAAVARGIGRLAMARVIAFAGCVRARLRRGTLVDDTGVVDCLQSGSDTGARLVQRAVARRCGKATLSRVLPGDCAQASAADLAACLAPRTACNVCLAVDTAENVTARCTTFAQGIASPYCGERPATRQSVARQWDEAVLAAIRKDLARPPIQARTLYHASLAMWDAWAAYDATARGVLVTEKASATDVESARAAAISFAVYRIAKQRYAKSPNAADSQARFDRLMSDLGYDPGYTSTTDDGPAALGNRIGQAVLGFGATDGANEAGNYGDTSWQQVDANPPLIVKLPGVIQAGQTLDPNLWQPLALDQSIDQNGNPQPSGIQSFVGPTWGAVTPFALVRSAPGVPYGDALGAPVRLHEPDGRCKDGVVEVLKKASQLDASDDAVHVGGTIPGGGTAIDISPGGLGNVSLDTDLDPSTDQGHGYAVNPVTGQPYTPNVVKLGDYARVLAEFWADGPQSETPPGHWNVIANTVSDDPSTVKRLGGTGPVLSDLEWDVKLYLALNGGLHDAAIAAWELKRVYLTSRPITLVRWMALHGPQSAPEDDGIPLVDDLIEVITPESVAQGRHAALADHVGEIAVRSWPGQPADPRTQVSGVKWVLGTTWIAYQRNTFVTPPFPGYLSGHSSYSRTAAEIMTRFTGSEYFPGGLGEYVIAKGGLGFEVGPTTDIALQWARYYDAADQAGISRRWGGIHPYGDDYAGRRLGAAIGPQAYAKALTYFDGTAAP